MRCSRCLQELWCPWSPDFYAHPLTLASLGKSRPVRALGNALVLASAAMLLTIAIARKPYQVIGGDVLLGLLLIGLCTYNIWAFTHGHEIGLGEALKWKPCPDETIPRISAVAACLALLALGWWRLLAATPF
jgi:hypothetical protein